MARARLEDRALGGAAAAHRARRDDAQVAGPEAVVPRQQGRRALAAAARLLEAHDRPAVEAAREPRAPHARQREARVLEPLVGPLLEPLLRDALLVLAFVRQEAEQPRRVLLLGVAALAAGDRVVVAGNSIGGGLCSGVAANSDKVAGLLLCNSAGVILDDAKPDQLDVKDETLRGDLKPYGGPPQVALDAFGEAVIAGLWPKIPELLVKYYDNNPANADDAPPNCVRKRSCERV